MPHMNENERREQAFLALIQYAESNQQERSDAYNRRNGGSHFHNMDKHPGRNNGAGGTSSASGAYQITYETYLELVKHGGPKDFSPQSQNALALQLLREKAVLPLIWDGQLQGAFMKLNETWNSLPGGGYQLITEKDAEAYFWRQVGQAGK